jgi:cbb3-type cytochrome oxidase subunit 1
MKDNVEELPVLTKETLNKPQADLTAKGFCLTSAFWFMIATFMGLLGATKLMAPDFLGHVGWLQFGRIRPIHVNLVLFGFVTPGLLSAAFYFFPRILRTKLYSDRLGVFTVA